jgi:hypothetical protein
MRFVAAKANGFVIPLLNFPSSGDMLVKGRESYSLGVIAASVGPG